MQHDNGTHPAACPGFYFWEDCGGCKSSHQGGINIQVDIIILTELFYSILVLACENFHKLVHMEGLCKFRLNAHNSGDSSSCSLPLWSLVTAQVLVQLDVENCR